MKTSIKLFALAMIVLASGWQESKAATMEEVVPVCLKVAEMAGFMAELRDMGQTTDMFLADLSSRGIKGEHRENLLLSWIYVRNSKLSAKEIKASMFVNCLIKKGG